MPVPEPTPVPGIVIAGQSYDYQRLAQLAASGQLQLNQYPGTPSMPQQSATFSSTNTFPTQAPALTQVAYMQQQAVPVNPPGYAVAYGPIPGGLMPVPQMSVTPNSGTDQAAAFPLAGANGPVVAQQHAGITALAAPAGYVQNQPPVVQLASFPQYLPGQQPGAAVAMPALPSTPAAAPLPVVYAQGQQVNLQPNSPVPSSQTHPAVSQHMPSPAAPAHVAATAPSPTVPAFAVNRGGTESSEVIQEAKAAPPAAVSATGTVGGLPLAFLRSFYSQMPQDQKTMFWRDLRQLPGTVSPAELAAYRELALSATDLARVEAAITMLAVYNQRDLAEELLKGMNNHPDPVVQQSAQTALSMLRISGAPAK